MGWNPLADIGKVVKVLTDVSDRIGTGIRGGDDRSSPKDRQPPPNPNPVGTPKNPGW